MPNTASKLVTPLAVHLDSLVGTWSFRESTILRQLNATGLSPTNGGKQDGMLPERRAANDAPALHQALQLLRTRRRMEGEPFEPPADRTIAQRNRHGFRQYARQRATR